MSFKKLYFMLEDSIVLTSNRVLHGKPQEDKYFLNFYKLAYIFANGANGDIPKMYFSEGNYYFEHYYESLSPDIPAWTSTRKYNPRNLKRMMDNLVNTRYGRKYNIPLTDEIYNALYNTLSYEEQIALGEWQNS